MHGRRTTLFSLIALVTLGCGREQTDRSIKAELDEIAIEKPMIDLGLMKVEDCRKPSIAAPDVETANAQLPCRQLKIVQHHLATLLDHSSFLAQPKELGDNVTFDDLDDPDLRRQFFFGAYWSTYQTAPAYSGWTKAERLGAFRDDLTKSFGRLMAVLIASTHPTTSSDGVSDWWWELPGIYRKEEDLKLRAEMMRKDVNAWIQASGIHVFHDVGTPDDFGDEKIEGDLDFILIDLIAFLYQFRDEPELLENDSVWALLNKQWPAESIDLLVDAAWTQTNIPVSGQDFESALWFGNHVGVDDYSFAETENHVLMTMTHFYLVNQWVANDYRDNLVGAQAPDPPAGWTAAAWWSPNSAAMVKIIRDIAGRVVHSGMFEDNARPYQQSSYLALLALATHAEDPVVVAEAENALHFLATTFAFQSLDGRRWAPMRRNCEYAARLGMYIADGLGAAMGILSGAYKWNDSPYGYQTALGLNGHAICMADASCHWRTYSFKSDGKANDSAAERIPSTAEQLPDDKIGHLGPQKRALFAGFANYRLPRAVHAFMIEKHDGYFARMMPQFDRKHYGYSTFSVVTPEYFDGDSAFDNATYNNEKTPAFYFATNDVVNASGGIYNPIYGYAENSYIIPINPTGPTCHGDKTMSGYDYLSRPYAILPQVPTTIDPTTGNTQYEPFGLDAGYTFSRASETLAMMRGNSDEYYKSANIATYKNFSYGYRVRDTGVSLWAKLGGEFPQDIPKEWDEVPIAELEIGSARFKIYDLRELMEKRGQAGYYVITARVRKYLTPFWSTRVARGFWEVVPEKAFGSVDHVAEAVKANNPAGNFKLGYGVFHKDFDYKMVTTGETLRLDQRFGVFVKNAVVLDEGKVQGIIGVKDKDGVGHDLETTFTEFMKESHTNNLPLIDVKELESDLNFAFTEADNHRYYACAQDGWICVNNRHDNSYLWVDSRRGPSFGDNPYWEHGTFATDEVWGCSCGSGGGSWTPNPPSNGVPEDCSDPNGCGGRDPSDPGDPGEDPKDDVCDPIVTCTSDSQCPSGVCDEPNRVCLCEPDTERCEKPSESACNPAMPECGPGEVCIADASGNTACLCPSCEESSLESCAERKPCSDPAETCVGADEPGDVGECRCMR